MRPIEGGRSSGEEPQKPAIREKVEEYVDKRLNPFGLRPSLKALIVESVVPVLEAPRGNELWELALETDDKAMDHPYGRTLLGSHSEGGPLSHMWANLQERVASHGGEEREYAQFREKVALRLASLKVAEELRIKPGEEKLYSFKAALEPVLSGVKTTLRCFPI